MNATDAAGMNGLSYAAMHGRVPSTHVLLQAGADTTPIAKARWLLPSSQMFQTLALAGLKGWLEAGRVDVDSELETMQTMISLLVQLANAAPASAGDSAAPTDTAGSLVLSL